MRTKIKKIILGLFFILFGFFLLYSSEQSISYYKSFTIIQDSSTAKSFDVVPFSDHDYKVNS